MDRNAAIRVLDTVQPDYTQPNNVLQGLQIIARHVEDTGPEFGHDIIWAGGDFDDVVEKMSEEEVHEMATLGWHYDDDSNSWAHF